MYRFKFTPKSNYSPKVEIIVYCVRDRKIASTHLIVDIHDKPKNFIELNVTERIKIGQTVDICVKSNPNAYIGLLGMDENLLQLRSNNDICHEDVLSELDLFFTEIKLRTQSVDEDHMKASSFYNNPWDDFSVRFILNIFNFFFHFWIFN